MEFPPTMHHLKVKKILRERVERGEITEEEASRLYQEWRTRLISFRLLGEYSPVEDIIKNPEFKHIKTLLAMKQEDFDRACPYFGDPIPAYNELPDVGKRLTRIFGPTSHHRRVWKILDMLIKTGVIDYATMMETYRVWRAMIRSGLRRKE